MPRYAAVIGITSDVVEDGFCDLSVTKLDVIGYTYTGYGDVREDYGITDDLVMETIQLAVRTKEDDAASLAMIDADELLNEAGWTRIGPWETLGDNAVSAEVTR